MIDRAELPCISNILLRLDIPPGRRGRTLCPIHHGENRQSFSYDDEKGCWYCFRCGFGGDAVELIRRSLDTDFQGALRWLGIEPGQPPKWDPKREQQRQTEADHWAELLQRQRELREEFRVRNVIAYYGGERLREDADSAIGWKLLDIAHLDRSLCAIEYELDELLERIPREAYRRAGA